MKARSGAIPGVCPIAALERRLGEIPGSFRHTHRLQTGPRERSPASYNTSRNSKFGSDMAADADAALRLPLDTEKKRHHDEERSKLSVGQFE
jgi:hypothetical protein